MMPSSGSSNSFTRKTTSTNNSSFDTSSRGQRYSVKSKPQWFQTDVQGLRYPGSQHSQTECQQQVSERFGQVTILVIETDAWRSLAELN
jgi:hypothetical protein